MTADTEDEVVTRVSRSMEELVTALSLGRGAAFIRRLGDVLIQKGRNLGEMAAVMESLDDRREGTGDE